MEVTKKVRVFNDLIGGEKCFLPVARSRNHSRIVPDTQTHRGVEPLGGPAP